MRSVVRSNLLFSVLITLGGFVGANQAVAQSHGPDKTAEQLVRVAMTADTDRVVAGETFNLVFLFDIDPHWHIYWESPGSTGMPTTIEVTAPDGFEVGPTLFTRPQRFGSADSVDGVTFGYEKHAALLVPVTAPADLETGAELTFGADVMWLVCKQVCLMGQASRTITLAVGDSTGGEVDEKVRRAKARLPRPLDKVEGGSVEFDGTRLTVSLPARGFGHAMLFPIERPGVTYGEPAVEVVGDVVTATVTVEIARQNALGEPIVIAGVIGLGAERDDPSFSFERPVPDA